MFNSWCTVRETLSYDLCCFTQHDSQIFTHQSVHTPQVSLTPTLHPHTQHGNCLQQQWINTKETFTVLLGSYPVLLLPCGTCVTCSFKFPHETVEILLLQQRWQSLKFACNSSLRIRLLWNLQWYSRLSLVTAYRRTKVTIITRRKVWSGFTCILWGTAWRIVC